MSEGDTRIKNNWLYIATWSAGLNRLFWRKASLQQMQAKGIKATWQTVSGKEPI